MLRTTATLILMLASLPAAEADWMDGNKLYDDAKVYKEVERTGFKIEHTYQTAFFCGYVIGVAEHLRTPAKVTHGQLCDIVVRYLEAHPEKRHLPGAVLIEAAFNEAFYPEAK